MNRQKVLELMNGILERSGRATAVDESGDLRKIGFRSIDFSELALNVEDEIGRELNFDADRLRAIETVGDVLDFFDHALSEPADEDW